jgi:hypothetical protein
MTDDVVLAGELGLLSLFDLSQLFLLNGTTGQLMVTNDGRRGYFYFDRGQIVNAVDDEYHEGEGAAYRLFTWKSGSFEFRSTPPSGARAITEGTEGLMMEAARRMDEAGDSGGLVSERLQQRAGALEALREVFQDVARQSGTSPSLGAEADGSPFAALREPSDALLFRPGHLPRIFHQGQWRDAGDMALDPAAYDQLRARLLDGAAGAGTSTRTNGVHTLVVPYEDSRYVVTRVGGSHEALWVRAAEQPPGEQLDGPLDALHALLELPAGLVLIGGPDAETADRLLHACVGQLTRRRAATVLLAADHGRWQHTDGAGALVRAADTDLDALLRVISPEVALFDASRASSSLVALQAAPLVIAAVVSPDADALVSRWCAVVGRRWGDGIETLLAGGVLGIAYASSVRHTGGHIHFAAGTLAFPGSRAAAAPSAPAIAASSTTSDRPAASAPATAAANSASDASAPESDAATAAAPALETPEKPDHMAALAAELSRTLRKAA